MGYPSLPVDEYREKLKQAVAFPIWQSIPDDPDTLEDEHRTWCSHFVRGVVRWFNFTDWAPSHTMGGKKVNGERAADIRNWMSAHPTRWKALAIPTGHTDYSQARTYASMGHLVVAAQVNTTPVAAGKWRASGHVCIVAPETTMWESGTFKCKVPLVANVGGKDNAYGIPLSKAFKPDPIVGCWLYLGLG